MIHKTPIISSAVSADEFLYLLRHLNDNQIAEALRLELSDFTGLRHIFLANSGIASFYLILKTLKQFSPKKEVIIPAYTAGSLILAVNKAGLKPVLCDISLRDFNLDTASLMQKTSRDTLAIILVHMFGIAVKDTENLSNKIPADIFLVEDCAQAMGTKIKEKKVGSFGDISFFSFNRGKNLPVCGGGFIATNSKNLAEKINFVYAREAGFLNQSGSLLSLLKILVFSLATQPLIYGLSYPLISFFRNTKPSADFSVKKICPSEAILASRLLKKSEGLFLKRYQNGMFLINSLKNIEGIILPEIYPGDFEVFNRLPFLCQDLSKTEAVKRNLWQAGIETSRMYLKPLHQMFSLGYEKDDFPRADYLAEHILTLPVYPGLTNEDLSKITEVIKKVMAS